MKKMTAVLLTVMIGLLLCGQAAAEKIITLTFAGDCTLGSGEKTRKDPASFDNTAEENGYSYFFKNFADIFSQDDCTIVNLEGVLSDSSDGETKSKARRYRGSEAFVNILREGSVEAVSLANDHINDYGRRGMEDTKRALEEAGIGWARGEDLYIFEKDDIRIAFAAVDYSIFHRADYLIRDSLAKMQKNGEISAAVILIHDGKELYPKHFQRQDEYSEYFINKAGADLIIMHHSQVVQGIRILNHRSVFYSLGNFVFGGNSKTALGEKGANSLYSLVVQARMYFSDEGVYLGQQVILYPAYGSGTDPENNYQPIRVTAEQAVPVMEAIQLDTEWQLPSLTEDEAGRAYAIMDYLPAEGNRTEEIQPEEGEPEAAPPQPGRNR